MTQRSVQENLLNKIKPKPIFSPKVEGTYKSQKLDNSCKKTIRDTAC